MDVCPQTPPPSDSRPLLTVDNRGHVQTGMISGTAGILVTSREDFGVNQTIVVHIEVTTLPVFPLLSLSYLYCPYVTLTLFRYIISLSIAHCSVISPHCPFVSWPYSSFKCLLRSNRCRPSVSRPRPLFIPSHTSSMPFPWEWVPFSLSISMTTSDGSLILAMFLWNTG